MLRDQFQTRGVLSYRKEVCVFLIISIITACTTTLCTGLVVSESRLTSSVGYRYAEYKFSGGIQFFSHLEQSVEGNLLWVSTLPNDQGVEFVNVTLTIANITSTLRFKSSNGMLFFNDTYYGTNVFEVSGLKAGDSVNLGSSTQRQVGVAKGPYQMDTPYGYQPYLAVEINAPLLNSTILSAYFYHVGTGLLLGIFTPAGWLFNLFGIEAVFGTMRLSSTNIDLGPANILMHISVLLPILTYIMIFVVIVIIYRWYKHRDRKNLRRFR